MNTGTVRYANDEHRHSTLRWWWTQAQYVTLMMNTGTFCWGWTQARATDNQSRHVTVLMKTDTWDCWWIQTRDTVYENRHGHMTENRHGNQTRNADDQTQLMTLMMKQTPGTDEYRQNPHHSKLLGNQWSTGSDIVIQTHKTFKRTLFIRTRQNQHIFRGNPLCQATKQRLNNS